MTIYDISKKAGVSIATVSRVINDSPKVSQKTKDKVMKVIEESGYSPNVFARGLGLNTMNAVGILCADSSDPFLAEAVYYIEQDLRKNGYDVILCCTGYELKYKQKYMEVLLSKRVDAVIMVGSNYIEETDSNNQYIRTAARKVPVMLVNGALDAPNVYSTLCDDFNAMNKVTSTFLNSGTEDILYLYNSFSYSGRNKLAGFKEAYKQADKILNKDMMKYINSREMSVGEICDFLCTERAKGVSFSAVVCADDKLAIGALKYAKKMGLKVPEEFAVTGFDNLSIATYCEPELTSVDTKIRSVCSHCVTSLMNVLSGKDVPTRTVFSYEIVKRGSTSF